MATRLTLESTVFNSGRTRFFRPQDFSSVPRLERDPSARKRDTKLPWRDNLRRVLRLG